MKPYYDDGMVTIYHGDCRVLDGHQADVVLTDPPYNVGYAYASHDDGMDNGEYLAWLRDCFYAATGTTAHTLAFFWQGIRVAKGEVPLVLPPRFEIHHLAAWYKREFAGDLFKGAHPAYAWEPITWATDRLHEAAYRGVRGGHKGRDCLVGDWLVEGTSSRHNKLAKGHPCPKTESVVKTVLSWIAQPGDLVLDPFMGSGTTLRVAKDLGIRAIGIEVEERYCEIAAKRMGQGAFDFAGVSERGAD